ncbi:hypothetical protein CR513_38749, partial [Mucuna pruriens]
MKIEKSLKLNGFSKQSLMQITQKARDYSTIHYRFEFITTTVANQTTIPIANNLVCHWKTRHFNIKLYFLKEIYLSKGKICEVMLIATLLPLTETKTTLPMPQQCGLT